MQRIVYNEVDILDYREGQDGTVEIYDIVVNSKRGVGVGTAMISELKQKYRVIYAFCRISNYKAKSFYRKNHFKEQTIAGFYVDEASVFVIWRKE